MVLLTCENIRKSYTEKPLITDVSMLSLIHIFIGIKASRARVLVNELVKLGKIRASGKNKGRRYKRI